MPGGGGRAHPALQHRRHRPPAQILADGAAPPAFRQCRTHLPSPAASGPVTSPNEHCAPLPGRRAEFSRLPPPARSAPHIPSHGRNAARFVRSLFALHACIGKKIRLIFPNCNLWKENYPQGARAASACRATACTHPGSALYPVRLSALLRGPLPPSPPSHSLILSSDRVSGRVSKDSPPEEAAVPRYAAGAATRDEGEMDAEGGRGDA